MHGPDDVLTEETRAECTMLAARALSVKRRFLGMYKKANAGHVGSSLSCAEIMVFLQFACMREHDVLVLSKGHAAAALYALLAEANRLTDEQIDTYYEEGTQLPALPPFNAIKEIPFATGSLGHGLSVSAGMAFGARLNRSDKLVFCVTSDGELDEGSVWEAALFIAHHRLTNVVWVIDRNQIQGIARTEEVLALEPLDAKLRAFGYEVFVADGHSFPSLLAARDEIVRGRGAPAVIIANTVKGNGLGALADTVDSHYLPMTDEQYARALEALAHAR